jgi:hypothetical protein
MKCVFSLIVAINKGKTYEKIKIPILATIQVASVTFFSRNYCGNGKRPI